MNSGCILYGAMILLGHLRPTKLVGPVLSFEAAVKAPLTLTIIGRGATRGMLFFFHYADIVFSSKYLKGPPCRAMDMQYEGE